MHRYLMYGIIASFTPLLGYAVGDWLVEAFRHADATSGAAAKWADICIPGDLPDGRNTRSWCVLYLTGVAVRYGGLSLGIATATITAALALSAAVVGRDSNRLARIFPRAAGGFVVAWSLLAVLRGGVLIGVALIGGHYFADHWPGEGIAKPVFGIAAIVAGVMALRQLAVLLRFWRRPHHVGSLDYALDRGEAPALYKFVDAIGRRLGVTPPAWLAITLDSNFSITRMPVRVPNRDAALDGGVMILSAPLMRVMTAEELTAVVAHELGHLGDRYTASKEMWGPTYDSLHQEISDAVIYDLSTRWHLGFVLQLFEPAIGDCVRRAEASADAATMAVASGAAAASAMLKTVVMSGAVETLYEDNFERMKAGEIADNLSRNAADAATAALATMSAGDLEATIRQEYAGDGTEPSIAARIEGFGTTLADSTSRFARRQLPAETAPVGDLTGPEAALTRFVHRYQQVMNDEDGPLPEPELASMRTFLAG